MVQSRRDFFRTSLTIGLGIATITTGTTVSAQTGGTEQWTYDAGDSTGAPTIVDGIVYISTEKELHAVEAATGSHQWTFETEGYAISDPTVVDGMVYVGNEYLFALDAATGEQQWKYESRGGISHGTPTVVDGRVYGAMHDLYAVDAGTGEELWTYESDNADVGIQPPTVMDGTVYVRDAGGSGGDTKIHAADATTGEQQWTYKDITAYSWLTVADETVYISTDSFKGSEGLHAVDSETGERIWTFLISQYSTGSTPTVKNGAVYVNIDGNLYAVDGETGKEQWVFNTAVENNNRSYALSPTVVGGTVYTGNEKLYAIDTQTGTKKWTFQTSTESSDLSSPTVENGSIYFGDDGTLYAVNVSRDGASDGSRVLLGTLGHHDNWKYANQSITIGTSAVGNNTSDSDTSSSTVSSDTTMETNRTPEVDSKEDSETAGSSGPGLGFASGLAGIGGASYLLHRHTSDGQDTKQ
jgi:outer membrane protein assembly factor BamB